MKALIVLTSPNGIILNLTNSFKESGAGVLMGTSQEN